MTITNTVTRNQDNSLHFIRLEFTEESIPAFLILLRKAMNCWPDAPKELKDLDDLINHGRITQDHTFHKINTKRENNPEYGTPEEMARIDDYIGKHGLKAWQELMITGQSNSVINPA